MPRWQRIIASVTDPIVNPDSGEFLDPCKEFTGPRLDGD
jgi:hypothetical protein